MVYGYVDQNIPHYKDSAVLIYWGLSDVTQFLQILIFFKCPNLCLKVILQIIFRDQI